MELSGVISHKCNLNNVSRTTAQRNKCTLDCLGMLTLVTKIRMARILSQNKVKLLGVGVLEWGKSIYSLPFFWLQSGRRVSRNEKQCSHGMHVTESWGKETAVSVRHVFTHSWLWDSFTNNFKYSIPLFSCHESQAAEIFFFTNPRTYVGIYHLKTTKYKEKTNNSQLQIDTGKFS